MAQGSKLTEDQIARVADALEKTPSWRAAADAAGVHRWTLWHYQERADEYAQRYEDVEDLQHLQHDEPDPDRGYWETVQTWLTARSKGEMEMVALWRQGADKDWRAAQAILRAGFPADYAERVEITGAGGGAIAIKVEEAVMEAAERAQAKLEKIGDQRPTPERE